MKTLNMKKIVNDNIVAYGVHDCLLEFNWFDYQLKNFWGKPISKFHIKNRFHKFCFLSFASTEHIVSLAYVDIGLARSFFGYVFEKNKGMVKHWEKTIVSRKFKFNNDFDNSIISFTNPQFNIYNQTNLQENFIKGNFSCKDNVNISYDVELGLVQKPLRTINPADFDHWVFTQKRCGLKLRNIKIEVDGATITVNPDNTICNIDYSGGFFRRDTNWLWASAGGHDKGNTYGFNFAIFNNNELYGENATWFNNEREHYKRIMFDWNANDLTKPIRIYTDDKRVELSFSILGEKADVKSRGFGAIKTNFHQYIGTFNGYIHINKKKQKISNVLGILEMHKSLW
ncbi:MAG: DUF2804 domain-containing protein [Mycoplasmataceae bacterium]|nr:DUF2804 domain-containing protein [Mycoplasmataceae bacterium]